MTIPLTGTGGLFTRIGQILGRINDHNTFRGTTLPPKIDALVAEYATSDQATIDGIYATMTSAQNAMSGFPTAMQTLAQNTLIDMANDDFPQPNNSLSNAMNYLITQMRSGSQTVKACTVGSSVTAGGSNTGNAVIAIGLKSRQGYTLENVFNETITATVTNDAQSGSATSGQESLRYVGQQSVTNPLLWTYPIGSGCAPTLTLLSATSFNGNGISNYLQNSNFELWTVTNIPDSWHIDVGTAGTTILQSTAQHYDGSSSLEFVGNGSELTSLYTTFGLDITSFLGPLQQFAVNLFAKVDVAPAAGVLEIALTDGTGAITQDSLGNNNVITKSLVTIGTTFVPVNGFFRTPRVLPGAFRLRIRLSTALSAGSSLFIDHAAFGQPTQLYSQGPLVAGFSGNVPMINGDFYTLGITNSYGGKFQFGFNQLFNMRTLNQGSLLPSATGGGETIPDSLVV